MGREAAFKGHILIYVYGYKMDDWRCLEHNHPTRSFPYPHDSGWAVGNNPRDRYCSRAAEDKLRRFTDFDEAVKYIFDKRQKRKKERFELAYELGNTVYEVSSLDELLAIDKALEDENKSLDEQRKILLDQAAREYPGLDVLRGRVSNKIAYRASELLKSIQDNEAEVAKSGYSKKTYYRYMKILREAGLLVKAL